MTRAEAARLASASLWHPIDPMTDAELSPEDAERVRAMFACGRVIARPGPAGEFAMTLEDRERAAVLLASQAVAGRRRV